MQISLETALSIAHVGGWREWAKKHLELTVGDSILVDNDRVDRVCQMLSKSKEEPIFHTDYTLIYNKPPLTIFHIFIPIPSETQCLDVILKNMTDIHIHADVLNDLSYRYECEAELIEDYKSKKKISKVSLNRHLALFKIMFKLVGKK